MRYAVRARTVGGLVCLLAAAMLLGAGAAAGGEKTVTVAISTPLRGFDPHNASATHERSVQINIYDSLTQYDREYRPAPGLAVSWKRIDNLTLEMKLRRGVTFHNGQPFTADDVVFTYDRILNSQPPTKILSWIEGTVKRVDKVDDFTVRVITHTLDAPLLSRLTQLYILPAKTFREAGEREFFRSPVGTGPYKFSEWRRSQDVTLVANRNYWGGAPKVDKVLFRIIPDAFARFAALKAEEVDIIENLDPARIAEAEKDPNLRVVSVWGQRNMWVGFNTKNPPLDNLKVRQALNHAVDVEAIVKNIFQGRVGRVVGGGFGALAFGYHKDLKSYGYDPKRAKQLLAEAGYPQGFTLEFDCPTNRYMSDREVCQAIAGYLAEVGVKTTLQFREWAVLSKMFPSGQMKHLWYLGYGNSLFDADFPLRLCCWSGSRGKYYFHTPELDKMIEDAAATHDTEARLRLYRRIQTYVWENASNIFLYDQFDIYGIRSTVKWRPWATELTPLHDVEKQ